MVVYVDDGNIVGWYCYAYGTYIGDGTKEYAEDIYDTIYGDLD